MADPLSTFQALQDFVRETEAARDAIARWTKAVQGSSEIVQRRPPPARPAEPATSPRPPVRAAGWQSLLQTIGTTPPRRPAAGPAAPPARSGRIPRPPRPPRLPRRPVGPAGSGGATGQAASSLAGMASRAAGVAGVMVMLAQKVHETVSALRDFTDQAVEGTREFRQFSGAINAQWMMMERQQLQLQFRTAAATSGTTKRLLEETRKMRESMQPLREMVLNAQNTLATAAARVLRWGSDFINIMVEQSMILRAIRDGLKSAEVAERQPYIDFLQDIVDGKYRRPRNGDEE